MFSVSNLEVEESNLIITIKSKIDVKECFLEFRLRDNDRFIIYSYLEFKKRDIIFEDNICKVKIDTKEFLKDFDNLNIDKNIFMIYIEHENSYYKLIASKKEIAIDIKEILVDGYTRLNLIVRKNMNFEIAYTNEVYISKVEKITRENKELLIDLSTYNKKIKRFF